MEKIIYSHNSQKRLNKVESNFIIEVSETFHKGIIGILASKLVDEKRKPSIVIAINDSDRIYPADITIFSSGSEIWVSLDVAKLLPQYKIRVVNMVSWEIFDEQSDLYKEEVIGSIESLKISIEAGVTTGWQKFTGINGLNFGINRFGESAPGDIVADTLGLTPSKIAKSIEKYLHTR